MTALFILAFAARADEKPHGPDRSWWSGTVRAADYEAAEKHSYYVTMRDGVKLAIDVYLPAGLAADARVPAILEQTRYYRSSVVKAEFGGGCKPAGAAILNFFVLRGYAWVVVDVRGTGASFGSRDTEYGDAEVADGAAIADWIVAQSWSNGAIGSTGQSYVGTTAEMLLRNQHPAVKAIAPRFAGYDFVGEITYPGGIPNAAFEQTWPAMIAALDRGTPPATSPVVGPCPVDEDSDGTMLRAAIAEHAANFDLATLLQHAEFRDDAYEGRRVEQSGLYNYQDAIEAAGVPVYGIAGWSDSGYALGAIRRFINSSLPAKRLLIGPWNHGGRFTYVPGTREATATSFDLATELFRFFDYHLNGIDAGYAAEAPIHYFTSGIDQWRSAPNWPVSGAVPARWCFAGGNALSMDCNEADGADSYAVDATATSGGGNRWAGTMGPAPVTYPDRAEEDRRLLTFTSAPLAEAIEVTGEPVVALYLATDAADADVFVYLEEVTSAGEVNYVTEGALRASRRKPGAVPYATLGPTHSDLRADAEAVQPGVPMKLEFALLPFSHVFKPGSHIRVALAAADGGAFRAGTTVPQSWTVYRSADLRSAIVLPTVSGN